MKHEDPDKNTPPYGTVYLLILLSAVVAGSIGVFLIVKQVF